MMAHLLNTKHSPANLIKSTQNNTSFIRWVKFTGFSQCLVLLHMCIVKITIAHGPTPRLENGCYKITRDPVEIMNFIF